jgi:hypothetical protein
VVAADIVKRKAKGELIWNSGTQEGNTEGVKKRITPVSSLFFQCILWPLIFLATFLSFPDATDAKQWPSKQFLSSIFFTLPD